MELPEESKPSGQVQEQPKAQHIPWPRRMLYLLNHALSCFLTDTLIQTPVSSLAQKYFPKWTTKFFDTHTHHDHEHEHHDHGHEKHGASLFQNAKHWIAGEAVGDFTAVPITAAMQHYMPWLMNPIRKVFEPFVGRYFMKGAARDAKNWAAKQGLDPAGPEAEAKKKELYEYEVSHLGPVVIWNILSATINIAFQKGALKVKDSWGTLAAAKGFSTVVSNVGLLSGRAMFPKFFEGLEVKTEKFLHKTGDELVGETHKNDKQEQPLQQARENDKSADKKETDWVSRSAQVTPLEAVR